MCNQISKHPIAQSGWHSECSTFSSSPSHICYGLKRAIYQCLFILGFRAPKDNYQSKNNFSLILLPGIYNSPHSFLWPKKTTTTKHCSLTFLSALPFLHATPPILALFSSQDHSYSISLESLSPYLCMDASFSSFRYPFKCLFLKYIYPDYHK